MPEDKRKVPQSEPIVKFMNEINPQLFFSAIGDILGRRYGVEVVTTVREKTQEELATDEDSE